jgi:hypothetical protein
MRPHHTDGVSLTFGVIFVFILVAWLFGSVAHVSLPNPGWFVAGALILFGLLGLVGMLRSDRRRSGGAGDADEFS